MAHDGNGTPLDFGRLAAFQKPEAPAKPSKQRVLSHAAVRAKERYGIDLSWQDVGALAARCMAGEGKLETRIDGLSYHALIVADRVLWLLYRSPQAGSPNAAGTVVTIMPPDVANSRARRDKQFRKQRMNRSGGAA